MKKILVVNNDIDTMDLIKMWLETQDYKVIYTGDEDEVPQIVKSFKPDVVIVDVLKEMAAKQLKSSEKTKHIPIIMMTGYTINSQIVSKDIVDDVIEKPFNPVVLGNKIKGFLKQTG